MLHEHTSPPFVKLLKLGRLDLAGFELDCAVVEGPDGKPLRVLSGKKMHAALSKPSNAKQGTSIVHLGIGYQRDEKNQYRGHLGSVLEKDEMPCTIAVELPPFLAAKTLHPFIGASVLPYLISVLYRAPSGLKGRAYPAELLPEVCCIYLSAREAGALLSHQLPIAERCLTLLMAFAKVGIVALVDEVTGYQEHREKDELQRLIQAYLGTSAATWVRTFTDDYYREVFRLLGLQYVPGSNHRPPCVGHFTSRAVYAQMLPVPVYDELKARNPFRGRNVRQALHHQWLSNDLGRRELQSQLTLVLQLMRRSTSEPQFWDLLEYGGARSQTVMPFFDTTLSSRDGVVSLVETA